MDRNNTNTTVAAPRRDMVAEIPKRETMIGFVVKRIGMRIGFLSLSFSIIKNLL